MSGPKTNRYTLTPEQRKALQDRLAIRSGRASLQEALAALNECARYMERHQSRIDARDLPDVQREIAAVQALLKAEVPSEPEALHRLSLSTQQQLSQTVKITAALREKRQDLTQQVDESIRRDIADGFTATLDDALAAHTPTREDYVRRLQAVIGGAVTGQTAQEARQALAEVMTITSAAFLQNFASITVRPLENRCSREKAQYAREQEEYTLLQHRCCALCQQLGLPAEDWPWHPDAMAELAQRTEALEQQLYAREEEACIRQALDEVMVEMGYTLLGERDVQKRSGARFHHALYDFGDGTAVDVTYDANGQVAMALGGLDDDDHLPDTRESAVLCRSMETFCTSFAEVEARLQKKGVVLKNRIAMEPPTADHAQIINVSDYRLTREARLFDAGRSVRAGETKKQYMDGE